ncbi:MAG: hypothetical protein ACLUE1_01175 [Adlercreutzia equolifaciens]
MGYLGTALAAGAAHGALCATRREGRACPSRTETLVSAAAALVTSWPTAFWRASWAGTPRSCSGRRRCLRRCARGLRRGRLKKTEGALSLAIVAVVGAFIGAVAYRVLMWTASIALMSLFGVSI